MTRDYAVYGYGIVLNDMHVDEDESTDENAAYDDLLMELSERGIVESQFAFTGEAYPLNDYGEECWGDADSYDDDTLYFIPLPHYPKFFKAVYENMDALIRDMKIAYDNARKQSRGRLPDLSLQDVRASIRSFNGTYYG